jgi:hypothetical protein
MKTIKLKAGLGNQLFQYAYGRNLIEEGQEIIFDTSFFSSNTQDTPRPFLLKKFNIPESIIFINQKEHVLKNILNKIYSKITGNYNFFQSELYFKNIEHIIRKEFTLKDPLSNDAQKFKDIILQTSNSVSIHIRRGDYISNISAHRHHGLCDINYYQRAITHITQKIQSPTFFIFSDDIEWAKENLNIDNAIYVSNPNLTECEELMLMSYCKHNIIANSTFSWWGAWLNQNHDKIVIAPKQWTTKKTSNQLNILPKSWIQI